MNAPYVGHACLRAAIDVVSAREWRLRLIVAGALLAIAWGLR